MVKLQQGAHGRSFPGWLISRLYMHRSHILPCMGDSSIVWMLHAAENFNLDPSPAPDKHEM
eukprot:14559-Eustigmatos_ZCMA.PRE.1